MPIKGLTDRAAQFPEIGRIRKGAPQEKDAAGRTTGIGKDLTYFRVEFDEREVDAKAEFDKLFGTQPRTLDVVLPFRLVEENWEAWREAYVAGGMVHRCDGERVWFERNPSTGKVLIANGDPEKHCDGKSPVGTYGDGKKLFCEPHGRLKVIVPGLRRLAFLTLITQSIYDVFLLSEQLRALFEVNGKLTGIPLKLMRKPMMISTPDPKQGGKRVRREKWLLTIEADQKWVEKKIAEMEHASLPLLPAAERVLTLPEPVTPNDEEASENGLHDEDVPEDPVTLESPPVPAPQAGGQAGETSSYAWPPNVGKDWSTRFWFYAQRVAKLDTDAARNVLQSNGGDFEAATEALVQRFPA